MRDDRRLEECKYYDGGRCPYLHSYREKVETYSGQYDLSALQPRCPKDAQRNKRGILSCYVERKDKMC